MRFGRRRTVSLIAALTVVAAVAPAPPVVAAGVSFSAPTHYPAGALFSGPSGVAVADLDENGHADLVVANHQTDDVSVLLGDGRGRFSATGSFAAGNGPAGIAVADFNEDGHADVVVANFAGGNTVTVLLGDGRGRFSPPTSYAVGTAPITLAAGDLNGDRHADVVAVNASPSGNLTVLLGDGAGQFAAAGPSVPTGSGSEAIVLSDFNRDGRLDAATADHDDGRVTVLLGDGRGGLPSAARFPAGRQPVALAVGDFNSDARVDLAVADLGAVDSVASVLLGDGAGGFGAPAFHPVGEGAVSIAVGDFDRNGHADLAVGIRYSRPPSVSLLSGDGAGHFAGAVSFDVGSATGPTVSPERVATGDFNEDGQRDLAFAGDLGGVAVLLNTTFRPLLTVTPSAGPQGATVTVRGSGYTPGSTVPVVKYVVPPTIGRKGFYRALCSAAVANDGSFQCRGQIPAGAAAGARGTHRIVAKDSTGLKAATTFMLT